MLSALKKLVGSEQGPMRDSKIIPAGLQSMNQSLQRRFAKGVQYNMKIVIRGDRNTGKTTLWHRLQGKKFVEDYIPTQSIQVTSIHWNYKTTDDVVKVEVWDIVDKGKTKKRGDTLKLENDPQETDTQMALDAEFLDVYKNCNGVVMMFDITKQWTFNYIEKELPNVPRDIPVCVLGNYRDMGEHRVILPDDVRTFIDRLDRPPGSSYILYAESSMKNSFGLKYLHKFLNIPFLQLQRETLLRQLETNQLDIDATLEELSVQQETEDQNYEIFLDMMEARSRGCPTPLSSNGQSPSSGSQSPVVPPNSNSTGSSSPGVPLQPLQSCPPTSTPSPSPSTSPAPVRESQDTSTLSSSITPAPPVATTAAPVTQKRSIISRLFGSSSAAENSASQPDAVAPSPVRTPNNIQSVDDFVPEESLDRSFLEDSGSQKEKVKAEPHDSESDGEMMGGNPMVAGFQDDVDPDDQVPLKSSVKDRISSADITLSSDEEEAKKHKVAVLPDEDAHVAHKDKWSSTNSLTPQKKPLSTNNEELKGTVNVLSSVLPEKVDNKKPALGSYTTSASASSSTPSVGSLSSSKSVSHNKVAVPMTQQESSSDSDLEGPIAAQMLSFVMDDPDFESEDSDSRKKTLEVSPVRVVISDISDEDINPPKILEVKTSTRSFKPKNDSDLFGLGFVEKATKESSEEDKESKSTSSREKKKKKKKNKEDEEKGSKKKSKPKSKEKEKDAVGEEEKKKKKHHKSKEKKDDFDELEAFLSGRDPPKKKSGAAAGEEDYEEL